ncbi:serine/threonine-protein kinase [Mycolicibacterium moriokaense]|uniref:non-specific serine/threonine protein kinase n=1 Tax=Mycolicibacterium moriokaense TaxID=39691 RepID=A0A318HCU8_9MYCO|nr:serine/threonine-protein kinase [Mycolicibacterium moriokaense]PXX06491.1 serine/threonine-protein kinase [Mycolicibacterium moriokaense]
MEGTPFGRYQLIELLGRGGMGEVWRAHDTAIDRTVALKMLLPHFAKDPDYEKRFRREARAAARLDDPHVVPIHDVGEIDGRLYVTMRLINGVDLQTLLNSGPLDARRAVYIVEQIASALHSAHQAGLVHRDVKPSNILLAHNDFAYLIDFGIARAAGDTALTSANTTIGTWAYMAPERFNTGQSDASSDIYALACVLYQCLTGELPFPGETLEQVAVSHMVMPPPIPSKDRNTIPTAMDGVIATGLAKKPTDRYPSAVEMAAAARQAITDPMSQSTPDLPVGPHPAATQPWQSIGELPAAPAPPPGKRRRRVLIGAMAGVVLLIVAGVVAGTVLTRHDKPAATTPPNTAPSGMADFTGIYRADFSATTLMDGQLVEGATPTTARWGVRSVCRPAGCVATALRLSGEGPAVSSLVFDEVDGHWVAVGLGSDQCHNAPIEVWDVFTLQPRPDGTLAGEYSGTSSGGCSGKGTVTFALTGSIDVNTLPDPAALPPRVVSPAAALRGHYQLTRNFTNGSPQQDLVYDVTTDCLRTGDRCMSYFHSPSDFRPLVFGGGNWTSNLEFDGNCPPPGGPTHLKFTAQYPMPEPAQDPITRLIGHGRQEQTGTCAARTAVTETFSRTGD